MALVVKDRVRETTNTTGTGTYTLAGAVTGFQSFSVIGNGNTTYYAVTDGTNWEVGLGTYTASGTTLARTTILESSNSGSAVNWGAGAKDIFVTYPAERSVYLNGAGSAVDVLDVGTLGVSTANISTANITAGVVTTTPTSSTDLVNKQYVDALIASGIHYHTPVRVESPTPLTATYNNGTAGVGATLTNSGTQTALVIDGVTVSVNDRVLIYTQTNQTQNGIYTVTNVGSGSTNWVLTRATDADSYVFDSPNGLSEGSTVFVQQGATGAGETYTCNTVGTITFGTTNITFVQVSSAQIYSAGTGLTLSGTQFSLSNVGTAGTYGSASQVPVITTNAQGQVSSVTNTNIAIAGSAITSGTVAVANGGTGQSTYTDGQLLIGNSTGNTLTKATLTAGTGITVTNGNGSITVAAVNNGTVTSVSGTGSVNGITLTGTVTSSGSLTLGGTLSGVSLSTQVTGTLPIANGGSGQTTAQAAMNAFAGAVTSGSYLRGNGTNVVMSTIQAGDVPTLNQNTTGTAANVTGTVAIANGGTGATTNTAARTNLGATTLGSNLFTITNPSAITFPRFNADNTVSSLDAGTFRTAIGAGTGNGTVTSVGGTGSVNGITLSGTVTSSGNLTLGGTLSGVSLSTQVTGTLPVANGGTGLTSIAALSIPVANSANTYTTVTPAAGQSIRINAGGTAWEAYTPGAGGGGVTSFSAGTTGLTPNTATTGAVTLAGTLALANGGTGQTTAQAAINSLAGAVTSGSYLRGNGTNVVMSTIQAGDVPTLNQNTTGTAANVTGTVAIANGGTGATTNTAARTNLGATTVGSNFFTLTNPSAITFPRINADNTVSALDAATFRTAIGAGTGSGTVTSVGATSPVASSGGTAPTISLNAAYGDTLNPYGSKTANQFLAAPNGTAGVPGFRAIVAADIPTLNQNTTGTAANVTGTVAIANGGTGATTQQAAINALAGAVTSAQFLRGNGTNVLMSAIQASDIPTLNQNTTGTAANVTGTVAVANGGTGRNTLTANNVLLGNGTTAVNFVAPGTNGNVLTSNGTTWVSQAPSGGGGSYAGLRSTRFTGNGTFTIPTGITQVKVTVVGGGGGGGGSDGSSNGGRGGGGGGTALRWLTGLTPGATLAVTVGGGGAMNGGTGGTSQVSSGTQTITTFSATGGSGGQTGAGLESQGGIGSGGDLNIGGQASATATPPNGGTGGGSTLGGGSAWLGAAQTGRTFGGGGAGAGIGQNAAAGAAGAVIFEY